MDTNAIYATYAVTATCGLGFSVSEGRIESSVCGNSCLPSRR